MNQVRFSSILSPPDPSIKSTNRLVWAVGLGLLTALLGSWIIGDFQHPLSDGNDTDQYEYVGYFFTKNLTLWPLPHLNLVNTQTFYPYGTNQVFLDWGFERDYWYMLCYRFFGGPGPYLQYYYVYTLVVAAVGTFMLLRSRFGIGKAMVVGLIVSVFNFYAIYKFPVHMNISVAHWTVLCIIATYRLLYDTVRYVPISLHLLLGWVWLHVQVLGQELGYVAGFALTFTTLTLPVLTIIYYRRFLTGNGLGFTHGWGQLRQYMHRQFVRHKRAVIGCLMLILISLYLYVPLTLQIAFTAWRFDFGAVPELPAWSHPLRLLIPYLPGFQAYKIDYQSSLRDTFESYGQGSPGLYLVLLAAGGWWQTRRRIALWLPVVLMLLLCLFYHPVVFPTLKLFPWFSFNRHGGRSSLIYPVLFSLLALPITLPRRLPGQLLSLLLLGLMGAEWYTAFSERLYTPIPVVSDRVLQYCATIRQQSGIAVLDWPFCAVGADGVGAKEGLCPYYAQQNAVFTFRRFYDKSGVGQYFGRLHPSQIEPFLHDGWPQLLTPNRSFTEQDWHFLDNFLRRNNFSGINLYPDLLMPEQVVQFYHHYGPPVAETNFPAAGRVVFLPLYRLEKSH